MLKKLKKKLKSKKDLFVNNRLSLWFYKSKLLSGIYYLLFSKSFFREYRAVLSGKVKHLQEAKKLKENYFLLVRNTHRIEKGLLMRPRKPVFGKDYIGETIDSFENVWLSKEGENNMQIKWFYDVLTEYFANAKDDEAIKKYYEKFISITNTHPVAVESEPTKKFVPYHRQAQAKANINYEEFYKLTKYRRSVRWFLDKPVPRELIDKAVLAANQSPSACNRQPFEFRIFDDVELVQKVVNFPMGTRGYGHSIPVIIVIVGNLDAYFDERDRHIIYIDASLAAMALILALETMGLSSCSINWPDIEAREKKMEKFLKLDKHQRPIMCLGLGYPDPEGMVAYSEKRTLAQVRKYNYEHN